MTRSIKLSNGQYWEKFGDASKHFTEMLGRYAIGDEVTDPKDHDDLYALLIRYESILATDHPSKIGCGIEYFTKETNSSSKWSSDGFWLHRTDGSSCDFSLKKALGPLKNEM